MAAKIKTPVILLLTFLLNSNNAFSQFCADLVPLNFPTRYEAQMPNGYYFYITNQTPNCPGTAGASGLPGMAINIAAPAAPNYMLDILSNLYVGDGVNVSTPPFTAGSFPNAVGYSIGGGINPATGLFVPLEFAWHSGDTTSAYIGIHAGYSTPQVSAKASYNTFVGNQTGINFAGTGAIWNTAVGYEALTSNTGGVAGPSTYGCKNVAMGDFALQSMQSTLAVLGVGSSNTAIGWAALQLFNPYRYSNCYANTALGSMALNRTDTGTRNTATGYQAEYKNRWGTDNVSNGHLALWSDSVGVANVAVGSWALYHNLTSNNVAVGYLALENTTTGHNNAGTGYKVMLANLTGYGNTANGNESMLHCLAGDSNSAVGSSSLGSLTNGMGNASLGNRSGFSVLNDTDCLFLGIYSDKNAAIPLTNATAIGAHALTSATNQMELGNNNVSVTIGRSGYTQTAPAGIGPANLEIATQYSTGWATLWTSPLGPLGGNYYLGTGTTGLRFDDLTSASIPVDPNSFVTSAGTSTYPKGVLSVDQYGNVIYIKDSVNGAIGYCPNALGTGGSGLAPLTYDGGYNLNDYNFYFDRNYRGIPVNNVVIGHGCGYTPLAKLDVYQHSDNLSSTGILVVNSDSGTCTGPVIGLKSLVNNPTASPLQTKIGGWFEATPSPNCTGGTPQTAIYVPQNGGTVVLGFPSFPLPSGAELYTYGEIYDAGNTIVYDLSGGSNALTASSIGTASLGSNIGAQGIASGNSNWNFGVQGTATGTTGAFNEGVYGLANCTGGHNYGIVGQVGCTGCGDYGVYSVGDVYVTGQTNTATLWVYSDSTIKTKVNSFSNALSIIKKLQPRTYYYDSNNTYKLKIDTAMHYGFIAQQVKRTVPCMVRTVATPPQWDTGMHITAAASTINALDYNQFAAILTAGFQEQMQISNSDSIKQKLTNDTLRATNDSLRYTLDSLRNAFKSIQNCLTQLCSHGQVHHHGGNGGSGDSNSTISNVLDVSLSSMADAPLLYQNIPNPFSGNTKINYYLPEGTQGATMVFYDNYGNQLKQVQLSQTGNGTLNINPENLNAGIYSYSLVVNGKIIDTKRMILQK
jgi:hypothetical protein